MPVPAVQKQAKMKIARRLGKPVPVPAMRKQTKMKSQLAMQKQRRCYIEQQDEEQDRTVSQQR